MVSGDNVECTSGHCGRALFENAFLVAPGHPGVLDAGETALVERCFLRSDLLVTGSNGFALGRDQLGVGVA